VRVVELRRELDLAPEALDVDPGGQLRREDLDHDLPLERPLGGDEDAAHPAARELLLEVVGVAEGGLELLAEVVGHDRGFGRCFNLRRVGRGR
jgi:hypothetical protein